MKIFYRHVKNKMAHLKVLGGSGTGLPSMADTTHPLLPLKKPLQR